MIIAAAQTKPQRFDINSNLLDHYKMIDLTADNDARLIIFPEMSLTGYEREKASEMAFSVDDSRLAELTKMAAEKNMIIIAGAPLRIENRLYIGAFILKPDQSVSVYTKQFLHDGEELYFKSSLDFNPVIELNSERLCLAICADISNPIHAENAHKSGATIYMSGIFYTPKGIPEAYQTLSGYAKKYSMNILMSNFAGQSWDLESGRKIRVLG
jgi:predicted amidohydrolase